MPPEEKRRRVFGTPGASLFEANHLSKMLRQMGIEGEQRAGVVLENWVEEHGGYVFHSVKHPSKAFDVDHILLVGSLMFLVDDKNWSPSYKYTFQEANHGATAYRNGVTFPGNEIRSAWQLRTMRQLFPGQKMSAFLNISSPKPTELVGNLSFPTVSICQTHILKWLIMNGQAAWKAVYPLDMSENDDVDLATLAKLAELATWTNQTHLMIEEDDG